MKSRGFLAAVSAITLGGLAKPKVDSVVLSLKEPQP